MTWAFETDPSFQAELDWMVAFVDSEVIPVDQLIEHPCDLTDPIRKALIPPLQNVVKERGLWACHLTPELGGRGYGQLKLALMNELLGRTKCGPVIFGIQAPDTGNTEILAHYGTDDLKTRYLEPVIDGSMMSSFSMTEPRGGTDPTQFTCRAELDGAEWVINGEKWFASNARFASFLIVMVVTEPDNPRHSRLSALVVPTDTPGMNVVRHVASYGEAPDRGTHAYLRFDDARVPADHLLGERGGGFAVAQTRLGGGRIHHAMRTVGRISWAFEAMCERALSRLTTNGEPLSRQQLVQAMIADSWVEIQQFRLLVLQTAWKIDRYNDYQRVRADISAVKALMPKVQHDVVSRAMQIHGSLGASVEMPFGDLLIDSVLLGLADGATEIHKVTLARQLLAQRAPTSELFPSYHRPRLLREASEKYADVLEALGVVDALEMDGHA